MHRVAKRFFEPGEAFCAAMDAYIAGADLSSNLSDELLAYERAPLDETVAEASHGMVTRCSSAAFASSLVWWASSQRLQQNLADYTASCSIAGAGGEALFLQCMLKWKAIWQLHGWKERRLIGSKVQSKTLLKHIYRFGVANQVDWGNFLGMAVAPRPYNACDERSDALDIKREFLQSVLQHRGVYTFVKEQPGDQPGDVHVPGQGGSRDIICFQVLNTKPGAKVLPYALDLRGHRVPMLVVFFLVWRGQEFAAALPDSLDISVSGAPEVIDVLDLAPWATLNSALHEWTTLAQSDLEGCYAISQKRLVWEKPGWNPMTHRDYPCYLMLKQLAAMGWRPAPLGVHAHRPGDGDEVKRFELRGIVARKSYLRCLLSLQSLWEQGLVVLHTLQKERYYQAALKLPNKALVVPGRLVRDYDQLFHDVNLEVVFDCSEHPCDIELLDVGAALQAELDDLLDPDAADGGGDAADEADDGGAAAIADGPEVAAAGGAEEPAALHEDSSSGSSSSTESSSTEEDDDADDDDAADDGAVAIALPEGPVVRAAVDLPSMIEGVNLQEEVYNEHGIAGLQRYHRIGVRCPLSSGCHHSTWHCHRWRSLTERNTRYFGRMEAVGFLGLWLARGSEFGSKADHAAFRPTRSQIETYLLEKGLM